MDCTHCFHKNCLDSFERFDPYYIKRCPICRANYTKKEMKLDNDKKNKKIENISNNNYKIKEKPLSKQMVDKAHPLYKYKEFMVLDDS